MSATGPDPGPDGSGEDIRVVVADDHPMFLSGLVTMLEALPGIRVEAAVATGTEAVDAVMAHQPDVAVMDLHMPDLNGIDATRRIVAASPHVGVLVITMFDEDESVFAAMRAGARGYLLKGADREEIARAVRAVSHGEAIFGPALAHRLIRYFAAGSRAAATPFAELTDREREVLDLVAQGRGNADIARALFVSNKTVRNHVSNIFTKLQVADRAQAIIRARQAGLGETR